MLVLTRKSQESITIGGDIHITVLKIDKEQVRLGIEAPPRISVHRHEVFEEIQRENKRALSRKRPDLRAIGDLLPKSRKTR